MSHVSGSLYTGYTSSFSFLTGFTQAVVSTTIDDIGISRSAYRVYFANGTHLYVGLNEGETTDMNPSTFDNLVHYHFADAGGGIRILDNIGVADPGAITTFKLYSSATEDNAHLLVDFTGNGGFDNWVGSIIGAGFPALFFAENNTYGPSNDNTITVTDNQTIYGWGGDDTFYGGSGNDTFIAAPGRWILAGGDNSTLGNQTVTGNDRFVIHAGDILPDNGARRCTIHGGDYNFNSLLLPGEVNTIEAHGTLDFSDVAIYRINRIEFSGSSSLTFGAGQFNSAVQASYIPSNSTVVGDAGADNFIVRCAPDGDFARGDVDLSHFTFANWSSVDKVTIICDPVGTAGDSKILAPNVATTIIGGPQAYGDILTGGTANDNITGGRNEDILKGNNGNDSLKGIAGKDTLDGGAGNDTLDGGAGDDVMKGGAGNDTFHVDSAADKVSDVSGADTVRSSASFALASHIEKLTLLGVASIKGTGNGDDNIITGNAGKNTLDGRSGNDTLVGNDGVDRLIGGTGHDRMTGGKGDDDFIFKATTETGKNAATRDVITDFTHGHDDIDLSAIDANGTAATNGKFKFLSPEGADFTGVKGQLHWFHSGNKTIVEGDIDGNKHADFQIELTGHKTLTSTDFAL